VPSPQSPGQAKNYNRTKLTLGLLSPAITFIMLVLLVATGFSKTIASWTLRIVPFPSGAFLLFAAAVAVLQGILTFPISFFSGFVLEHRYGLSDQSLLRWGWERLKGLLVGGPLGAVLVLVLYYCLDRYGNWWWLPVAVILTLFSVVLARIAPVLLLPLFYRLSALEEGPLRERIVNLCQRVGLHIEGIYTFNLSKNTRKANAGFTGIGKARRILLGDTLVEGFTEEEIETVFAHELGHYALHHLRTGILLGAASTFLGLFVAAQLYAWSLVLAGFSGLTDPAALPLLALWLSIFALVTGPLGNLISRRHEFHADAFAVRTTGLASAFSSALQKLARLNLADPEPHPLVEFLFYSHPSISHRLRAIASMEER
jgi:STE24 endopeptidase